MERLLYTICLTLTGAISVVFLALAGIIATAPSSLLFNDHESELRFLLIVSVLVLWVVIVSPLIVIFLLVRERAKSLPVQKDTPNRDLLPD